MIQEEELIEFLSNAEIETFSGNNHKYSIQDLIANIPVCVKLLYQVVGYKTDDSLARFQSDFFHYLDNIVKLQDFNSLPISIEGLGQKFESFLRIIAYLKGYGNTEHWYGNEYSKGIIGTSLGGLCMGLLENTKFGVSEKYKQLKLHDKLFKFHGINKDLVEFVREGIRNKVHHSENYNRRQIISYSEKVIVIYLLVIQDNFELLSNIFLPEYRYLKRIVENLEYRNLDTVYVDLFGKEFSEIDIQGTRVVDVKDIINDLEHFDLYSDMDDSNSESDNDSELDVNEYFGDFSNALNDVSHNIIDLSDKGFSFFIIGDPGAGKSTALLKILFQNSRKVLSGANLKIPIYLSAKEFSETNNFFKMIKRNFGDEWSLENLKLGNYLLLIDGLNEISQKLKSQAIYQLQDMLHDFSSCTFIFSERKISFQKYFECQVYELKPLEVIQIEDFVRKYGKTNSSKILIQLHNNQQLMELAHNPLMLKMILSTSKSGSVPDNKGRLFDLFVKTIFNREEKKRHQISIDLKLETLSKVSFELRRNGQVSCNFFYFKELLKIALNESKSKVDLGELYNDLMDNFILKVSERNEVSFVHESYLEYFVGYRLMSNFKARGDLELPSCNESWLDPILICVGLLNEEADALRVVENLCYVSFNKQNKQQKKIAEFSSEDFNAEIYIPAKVAASFQFQFPKIYSRVEDILNNYLALWKYLLFENGQEALPVERLFKAVAVLNSERLLQMLFCKTSWVYFWLYFQTEKENTLERLENADQNLYLGINDEMYKRIASTLAVNTIDISIIYKQIEISLQKFGYFSSISKRIQYIKKVILENVSYKNLKDYYNKNGGDGMILNRLVQLNYEDIVLCDFEDYPTVIIKSLLRYHITIKGARKLIVEQLKSGKYRLKSVREIVGVLYRKDYLPEVFEVMEHFIQINDSLDQYFVDILQQIQWEKLSENMQEYFLSKIKDVVDFVTIYYRILNRGMHYLTIISEDLRYSSKGNSFFVGRHISHSGCVVTSIEPTENCFELTIVPNRNYTFDLKADYGLVELSLNNSTINFFPMEVKLSKRKNLLIFFKYGDIGDFGDSQKMLYANEMIGTVINMQKQSYRNEIKIEGAIDKLKVNGNYLNLEIPNIEVENDVTKLAQIVIHPSFRYTHSELILSIIERLKIDSALLMSFLTRNRLLNYYSDQLIDPDYGMVTSNSIEHKKCCIYFFKDRITKEYKFQGQVKVGNIVLVDDANKITTINFSRQLLDEFGITKGEIIKYDPIKNVGFISPLPKDSNGDCFFSDKNLDFVPENGMLVEFISAPNPIEKYRGKFVAYNLAKI